MYPLQGVGVYLLEAMGVNMEEGVGGEWARTRQGGCWLPCLTLPTHAHAITVQVHLMNTSAVGISWRCVIVGKVHLLLAGLVEDPGKAGRQVFSHGCCLTR